MMKSPELIQHILEMLDFGLGQRAIARRMKLSRGFVDAVANGRITPASRAAAIARIPPKRPNSVAQLFKTEVYTRCPICRGLVLMPCVLCALPSEQARRASGVAFVGGI